MRRMATTMYSMTQSQPKPEGDISSVFASLSGVDAGKPLEPRFSQLKAQIIRGHEQQVKDSWYRLLDALKHENDTIRFSDKSIIPEVEFNSIKNLSADLVNEIRNRGTMIVRGVLPENEALKLKLDAEDYIKQNPNTKAFPKDKPVVYELYWSPSQIRARANYRVAEALAFANSLWHASPSTHISLSENIIYADRLRIRQPGDTEFALGPHVDGGSIERWEDYEYRSCYKSIFEGRWEENDFFDATHRVGAQMSLYNTIGGCSIFRSWQGWLSASTVAPGEGGLLVNPLLKHAASYWLLRPFFTQTQNGSDWEIDTTSIWQGAIPGRGQEMNDKLHPHLQLSTSMIPIPKVRPGDMVLWHCDTIHAVDSIHRGQSDSSVFYIPAVPLCEMNVKYLAQQRDAFLQGIPPPDFPGGEGESHHIGRGTHEELIQLSGGRSMGFDLFSIQSDMQIGEKQIITRANTILNL
ncbi:unnamed protein product [Rotaria socialis]|uniref:DUF1479-domain-containing protein n=5 Tax=Rotaria socialis TaxID=392032 RepID=A0A821QY18_9BILA|nr:unnamed protein product [Rotaria socialis]CAF4832404.1 unnamed protein product [Rotaria socialis]